MQIHPRFRIGFFTNKLVRIKMQIRRVSFQRDVGDEIPFSQSYRRQFSHDFERLKTAQALFELLEFLENEVEAPPHWACTSLFSVSFYNRDFATYDEFRNSSGFVSFAVEFFNDYQVADPRLKGGLVRDLKTYKCVTVKEAGATIARLLEEQEMWVHFRKLQKQL